MTILFPNDAHHKSMDMVQQILESFFYPKLDPTLRARVQARHDWMRQQGQSFVNAQLETVEGLTKISLTISHTPIAPIKPRQN